MRIGIDIDDTITQTYKLVINNIINSYNVTKDEIYGKDYNELKILYPKVFDKSVYIDVIKNVKLKRDVKKILNKIIKKNEIYFITARNSNDCKFPYNETLKYLNDKEIPFTNLDVNVVDKDSYCLKNNIDLFIDDSINNCTLVNNVGIKTILIDTIYNKNSNLFRLTDWNEILEYIERIQNG